MIYTLQYATGMYEDYKRYDLFYGDKDFIEQKLIEAQSLLDVLVKRAQEFCVDSYWYDIDDVLIRYFKALRIPVGYIDGGIDLHIGDIRSYEEFTEIQK